MTENLDIAIIGGGPVGMFASFYAGLRDVQVALFESLDVLGGQVQALYPEKNILDVAGFAGLKGHELISRLEEQMALFDVEVHLSTTIVNVSKNDDGFALTTDNNQIFQAKTVIITTGKGSFEPRKMQVDGIEALVGNGVHYFVPSKAYFTDKTVMIAGGGDSAVDMAAMLDEVAQSVALVHRRDQFRAMETSIKALKASNVQVVTPQKITAVTKNPDGKLAIALENVKDASAQSVHIVDDLVINYGFTSENKTVQGWDVQPKLDGMVFAVNQEMATSIDGLYAIGDTTRYPGRADLIAIGFGEAPQAVNSAIRFFDPDRGGPGHSSAIEL